jgi:hypothetical protein
MRTFARRVLPLVLVIGALSPLLGAWHWAKLGWRDHHYNYPNTPSGYTQIVNRFGEPCSAKATWNHMVWPQADTGTTVRIAFHRKLGGFRTEMVGDENGLSTNLDNDVYGHIRNDHVIQYTKHGIYTYACRLKRSGSEWSTHAWGIAIDISSAYEPMGQCYSTTNKNFAYVFKQHGWHWGLSFCDPMHFQYATDY